MADSRRDDDHTTLIPIREAAELLEVSIGTLRRWDREGHLQSVRLAPGSPRRYKRSEIDALINTEASA